MKPLKRDIRKKAENKGYNLGNKGAIYWLTYISYKHGGKMGVVVDNLSLNDINIFIDKL